MGTKNTDLVANFEATPQVKNNAAELHGVLRKCMNLLVTLQIQADTTT